MITYPLETRELYEEAAEIAAAYSIKGFDAIYAGLAHQLHVPLVTFDSEQLSRGAAVVEVVRPE